MPIPTFAFDPASGFNDTTVYTNPTSGAEARQQLQTPLNQLRDYINEDLVPNLPDVSSKANINSPTFTGTPKAPTASVGTNTTQIATTAYVKNELTSVLGTQCTFTLSGTTLTITPK